LLALSAFGAPDASAPAEPRLGAFPFYQYATSYDIWAFTPMDQGGRLVQLQVIGSERDTDIVRAVRAPDFLAPWGDPVRWDALENTELEKSVWLNRWYVLPCFARQYYLTGDKAFLRDLLAFLRSWRDGNPAPADPSAHFATGRYNWRDMQVAWRVQNLAWCFFLGKDGFTATERREIYEIMATQARFLLAYFRTTPLNENNHQSHAASSMLYASLLFPDLPDAAVMKSRALEILAHHLDKAFFADGNSIELCPGYYPFFTSIFRDSYLLCRANGVPPPPGLRERLVQFHDYLRFVRQPDGLMPPVNDSSESSAAVPLKVLAEVCDLPPRSGPAPSHWFPSSQQAVMRDPDVRNPAYVFLDAGQQILGHWHGGKLGFHLWFGSRAFLVDSGVCNYDEMLRLLWYVRPEAHNTVLVDGEGDHIGGGTDRLTPLAGSRIVKWESGDAYDWAVMTHDGFRGRKEPVSWRRDFILLKGVGAIVVDHLRSSGEHSYTWLYHFLPCALETRTAEKSAMTLFPDTNLLLLPASPAAVGQMSVGPGSLNVQGRNAAAPVVRYQTRGGDVVQAFLLLPVDGSAWPEVRFTQVREAGSLVLDMERGGATIRLTLGGLSSSGPSAPDAFSLHVAR